MKGRVSGNSPHQLAGSFIPFSSRPECLTRVSSKEQPEWRRISVTVAVAAEAATEATKQEDDEDNDEYKPKRK